MKKKETQLLLENWRKFLKEENEDDYSEDENIFRSFDKPKTKPESNVLDRPNTSDSLRSDGLSANEPVDDENFYASRMPDEFEDDNVISDPDLIQFCERMGIDCDRQSLIRFLERQARDSNLDRHGNFIPVYDDDGNWYNEEH